MPRLVLIVLAIAACSNRASGPTVTVIAIAGDGDVGEAGATVVSHRVDGTAIDEQIADGTGTAEVITEAGAFVSVVFPGDLDPLPATISIVTAPAPIAGGDLTIHSYPHAIIPQVVGGLTVTAPTLTGAASFAIDLGCVEIAATSFPDTVNVLAPCEGTDTTIDVLVRGFDDTHALLGYGAGRVPFGTNEAGDEVAELDITTWATTGQIIPVTQTGMIGATAGVELDLVSDTLVYPTPTVTDQAQVWTGFVVDSTIVTATAGGQITQQFAPGTPTAIALSDADFLGSLSPGLQLTDRSTLAFQWADLEESSVGGADAFDLHVTWTNGVALVWDAVLPTDATQIAFPQLDASLQQVVVVPAASDPVTTDFAAIDSSDLASFDDLEAAGIYAADAIVPTPTTGEIRTSHATGSF